MDGGERDFVTPRSLLRLQSWLSPTFPTGSYSYSHGLEQAVETKDVHDRGSLVDWLDADLRYGSSRNDAIFFVGAWRSAADGCHSRLVEIAEIAGAYRGTRELALEASQQGASSLVTLREVWPDLAIERFSTELNSHGIRPVLPVVLAVRTAADGIPVEIGLRAFLNGFVINLVTAGVRLIPLGQTDGQRAMAELESAVLEASDGALCASIDDLGSAALMLDLSSMSHETQYTRLFRS